MKYEIIDIKGPKEIRKVTGYLAMSPHFVSVSTSITDGRVILHPMSDLTPEAIQGVEDEHKYKIVPVDEGS